MTVFHGGGSLPQLAAAGVLGLNSHPIVFAREKGSMKYLEKRKQLRAIFSKPECPSPASVFDPLSARIAEMTGFNVGLFSGKIASATTLAAPDLNLITLTEFADQVRRI